MATTRSRKRWLYGAAGVAAVVLTLSACGSSGSAGGDSSAPTGSTSSSSGDPAASLKAAYAGFTGTPPTQSVPARSGIRAWVMSCGQVLPTCATPSDAIKEAADTIGWDTTICDGKLNPNGWAACIRQGVAQKADVIFVIGQDCSAFQGPLDEAKKAGIVTIGVGSNDCDVQGGPKTFSAITQRFPDMTNQQWWTKLGELQADYVIGKTDGKAKVLELTFSDSLFGTWISQGMEQQLATCVGCSIVGKLQLTNNDVGAGSIGSKFSSALVKATDANAVTAPLDPWFLTGLAQAVASSGRASKLTVVGAFGQQANLDLIRGGQGETATAAYDQTWEGWSGVDTALRVLAKQTVEPGGIGAQVVDATNNMPAAGKPFTYNPPVDFKSLYKAVWTK